MRGHAQMHGHAHAHASAWAWACAYTTATKVLAHVTHLHKKLLNLAHDWLYTFMPHCLGKINRVSFGLLNEDDCEQALEDDPHMPRSRLKLAVPFMGKDVPSRSSEFAHPASDVTPHQISTFTHSHTSHVMCMHRRASTLNLSCI